MKTTKHTFVTDDLEFVAHLDNLNVKTGESNFIEVLITVTSFVAEFKMIGDMASADEWDINLTKIRVEIPKEVHDGNYAQLLDQIQAMCTTHAQENIETVWKSMGWKGYNHA